MSNISSRLFLLKTIVMLLAIFGAGAQLRAQTPIKSTPNEDPFGQWHQALSSAADSLLTTPAQRQPGPDLASATAGRSSEATDVLNLSTRTGSRERAWQRVEQLRPKIEPILREEGVPTELAVVVLIESGGQATALSPKGARGIWQFMPETARRYGLAVRPGTDERLDVQKSTRAAARYLADLYQRFGDWPLALAAYNAGEEAVGAAVAKAGRADFAGISSLLPLETRNYVPAVLSAMRLVSILRPAQLLASGSRRVLYAAANLD